MSIRKLFAAAALWCGALAATAAHAADTCVPAPEAEGLFLFVAPTLINTVSTTCAPSLPRGALLRDGVPRLTAKYASESEAAWPQARSAIGKIAGPDAAQLLSGDTGKAMVPALVGPLLAKEIKPADCPAINRVLTQIDPLPAKNTAALIVTIVDLASRKKADKPGGFTICPIDPR